MLRQCFVKCDAVRPVYSMTASQLRAAFKAVTASSSSKLWDALMYRASIVRSDFSINDVSVILNKFSEFPKFKSPLFLKFLVEPIMQGNQLPKGVSLMDLTMILKTIRKLKIVSPEEAESIIIALAPVIGEKLSGTTRLADLGKAASVLRHYPNASIIAKMNEVVSNLEIEKLTDTKIVTSFLDMLSTSAPSTVTADDDEEEPFYSPSETTTTCVGVNEPVVTRLLNQAISLSSKFNHRDVLVFASVMNRITPELLRELGHPSPVPIASVISRAVTREVRNFKPAELTTLLEMKNFGFEKDRLMDEFVYRIRDFRCSNCVRIVLGVDSAVHPKVVEAVTARLVKFDASSLTTSELVALGNYLCRLDNVYFGRQVLLNAIPKFRADILSFLSIFSQLKISHHTQVSKLVAQETPHLLDQLRPDTFGSFALAMVKLGIPVDRKFQALGSAFTWDPVAHRTQMLMLLEAVAIDHFAHGQDWNRDIHSIFSSIVVDGDMEVATPIRMLAETPDHPLSSVAARVVATSLQAQPMSSQILALTSSLSSSLSGVEIHTNPLFVGVKIESLPRWVESGMEEGPAVVVRDASAVTAHEWIALVPVDRPSDHYFGDNRIVVSEKIAEIKFVGNSFNVVVQVPSSGDVVTFIIDSLANL